MTTTNRPRTRHLQDDGSPRYTNRLLSEASPYLLQHAHNPVDWRPWGDEAFDEARRLGRPVLLSVGYSTCHWCHVMEEESFEDLEIARYLNENYVAIKVDREERPDVDSVYMTAIHLLAGRGGWPMTVWLTPDREPFYGGTYYPPRDGDRGARVGFLTLLQALREVWDREPERVAQASARLVEALEHHATPEAAGADVPGVGALDRARYAVGRAYDPRYGGMKGAPKFPSSLPARFLLRHHRRTEDPAALDMARRSLDAMADGGMYDQVGGGFHRYSTDQRWRVPHFEKMLYDNALLVVAYLESHQATGEARPAEVAEDVLAYLERDMRSPAGAFWSATDADSLDPSGERVEGWYFTWTTAELDEALGPERAARVGGWYGVRPGGDLEGRTVLHRSRGYDQAAAELGIDAEQLRAEVAAARVELRQIRDGRPPPLLDDKVITAWNGLAISAFARASLVLAEPRYAEVAAGAAGFVLSELRSEGRLHRSWRVGRLGPPAVLEDHTFLAAGLVDLFEATGDPRWLEEAIAVDRVVEDEFEDPVEGGWFAVSTRTQGLLVRDRPTSDGAEPAGGSVHTLTLLRLAELTGDHRYQRRAELALRVAAPVLDRHPTALSELLLAVDWVADGARQVVIVVPGDRGLAEPFLAELRRTFVPNAVLVVVPEDEQEAIGAVVPMVRDKVAVDGQPTAYVCRGGTCDLPTTDPEVFAGQLRAALR